MCHERPADLRPMHLHVIHPPIGFTLHRLDPAALGRATAHRLRLNADDVLGIESIQRFLPRLLARELNHFVRDFLGIHPPYLPNISAASIDQRNFTSASVVSFGRSSRPQCPVSFSSTTVTSSATNFICSAS